MDANTNNGLEFRASAPLDTRNYIYRQDGPDELWVEEVDPHPSRGILDTTHRRKVAVANGCDRITILHERRAHAFQFC